MSAIGPIRKGRCRAVRCDGCGRLSSDDQGYYFDRKAGTGGNITSHGRGCEHDYCDQCEDKLAPEYRCPKCGAQPEG